ncbi:DUF397 domain-containing protein [Streptomyces griseocarneus]|nr:DUF397 domain-containing protein [Streptomyces griseocarneus]
MPDIRNAWSTSSYSNAGQNCVAVSNHSSQPAHLAIRDSKLKNSPTLAVQPAAWASFVDETRAAALRT